MDSLSSSLPLVLPYSPSSSSSHLSIVMDLIYVLFQWRICQKWKSKTTKSSASQGRSRSIRIFARTLRPNVHPLIFLFLRPPPQPPPPLLLLLLLLSPAFYSIFADVCDDVHCLVAISAIVLSDYSLRSLAYLLKSFFLELPSSLIPSDRLAFFVSFIMGTLNFSSHFLFLSSSSHHFLQRTWQSKCHLLISSRAL